MNATADRIHCPPGEIHPIGDRFYPIADRISLSSSRERSDLASHECDQPIAFAVL
jgi:hypothetical protein